MQQLCQWAWVEAQVTQTVEVWSCLAMRPAQAGRRFSRREQQEREKAYDNGLRIVECEARRAPQTKAERLKTQNRLVAAFARFSATALDLEDEAVELLTNEFLPVGTGLARFARQFDASLSMADITQACRNAWTACGLQPLLGERVEITPSILAYSLLYPYSDNYLDRDGVSAEAKLRFSGRFRERLAGENLAARSNLEAALWTLVQLIEEQYPRAIYPQVYDCLLAIHRAQEYSIEQLNNCGRGDDFEVLRVTCAKGGSSVLADACLAHGWLSKEEAGFAFAWGVLLQLGDDVQDVRDDLQHGSRTLFSRAASLGLSLDDLVSQLLNFSEWVGERMDRLPNGSTKLKRLLRMSWRSLILMALAEAHEFFSPGFLAEAELSSPFRFAFLRERRERLTGQQGLYATLFDAFLEAPEGYDGALALPTVGSIPHLVRSSLSFES
jgi:hypothetical protein